ncbi:MAG: chemotaxis protein CheB [Gemmatimonadaceae bacterium]
MSAAQRPEDDEPPIAPDHSKGEEHASGRSFPIVGIGASAGGFEAFRQLLGHLPAESGMAFILVQHLDPRHDSRLAELLAKSSAMPVIEAANGLQIRANHVYVIPSNTNLGVARGLLVLTPRGDARGPHLPIDFLFRTLAEDQQGKAIGVVLSGTGSDGTLGLCEIKAVGGITFAQEERSAGHAGMPTSAIDSGCVDFVMSPEQIAERIVEVGRHPYLAPAGASQEPNGEAADSSYKKILGTVRSVMGVDFSLYRDTTIRRRIMRRMAVHSLRSLDEYVTMLGGDRAETEALYHDLLINVTSFFRDPDVFDALKTTVFPDLLAGRSQSTPVRVWVPGCSTGQEAYSIAIAWLEFLDDKPIRPPIQVFATDLSDPTSLDRARAGVYPETIEGEVSADRLQRFFTKVNQGFRIEQSIRDACVFARQNVTADPPFSRVDLISCRNVLIYLSTPLQRRVLPTFHYALNVPGFLLLGTAETIGENIDLFDIVDRSNKLYVKRPAATRPPLYVSGADYRAMAASVTGRRDEPAPTPADFQREADRVLLSRYSPPGVLVNDNLEILQYRGRTSDFLEAPPGEPTTNLLKLAREGLFLELRSAIAEVKKRRVPVQREAVRVFGATRSREVKLEVLPVSLGAATECCYLVLFKDVGASPTAQDRGPSVVRKGNPVDDAKPADSVDARELAQLRQELAATREYLQSLIEQQDAANEELRSANEEVLSSNEELQSTNEELETAKEELESGNEELTTVNEQLQQRNIELSLSNSDLSNFLSSTNIAVVMVGGDLKVRRFTTAARKVMNLLPSDVGRPISDLRPGVNIDDLGALITEVIEQMHQVDHEVRDQEGHWYSLRIYPYRASDSRIDGAVIVLVDIDQHKRSEEFLRESDRTKDEFLATLAHELRNPLAPIRNAVEILRLASDDAKAVEHARGVLTRQVKQLTRIVEDLIDVSRIVEKKVELRREQISLNNVVEAAVETCKPMIESLRHEFSLELPTRPVYLDADPMRIEQVVVNLLNNAAKFTPAGGHISLKVGVAQGYGRTAGEHRNQRGEAVIRIRDDGIGIPSQSLGRIFDMFTQADPSPSRVRGGLGVGLSLVRSLVEMHGGRVQALSQGAGQGSEFVVYLPISEGRGVSLESSSTPEENERVFSRKILVVDDNVDQAESLALLLKQRGHSVLVAHRGDEALAHARSLQPDLVVLDVGLPGKSGYEVAKEFRRDPRLRETVLIAQTGWGLEEDQHLSREAGFDHHLVKPVDLDVLERIISGVR